MAMKNYGGLNPTLTGKEIGWSIVVAVICLMVVFLSSRIEGKGSSEILIDDMAKESMEYQLAIVNGGGYVPRDDITVARFRSLLDQLSSIYVEDKQEIADASVTALKALGSSGISENLLNIMEGMNQIFFTRNKKTTNPKYVEHAKVYVGLRIQGQSHRDAIALLQIIRRNQ